MIAAAIDTPAVLIDLDTAEANIRDYQRYCDEHGLKLRPHIKTHKLPGLAEYQLAQGAVGITCQKVSEAEAMVNAGRMQDVLIAYNILGEAKVARLRRLAERVSISVVADNIVVANGLSQGFADAERPLPVLVECNTGAERCGVPTPAAAADLALDIAALPGLAFAGLMTYPPAGQTDNVTAWLSQARDLILSRGLEVPVISSGGSPDMWHAHEKSAATEYRVGTYVYNDRSLVERKVCGWQDCALTVLSTVVSVSGKHAIIDAGSKALTSDLFGLEGHGFVPNRPNLFIDLLSEEHGRVVSRDGALDLRVGDRLRIVPNHACVVSNLFDTVVLLRGDRHVGEARVAARGQVW